MSNPGRTQFAPRNAGRIPASGDAFACPTIGLLTAHWSLVSLKRREPAVVRKRYGTI